MAIRGANTFAKRVDEFAKMFPDKAETITKQCALLLFKDIIFDTPVLTGRARANWQIGIGGAPTGVLNQTDESGNNTYSKIASAVQLWRGNDFIIFTNNLPYINRLEYGWSKKAPRGMVRRNLKKWNSYLASVIGGGQ